MFTVPVLNCPTCNRQFGLTVGTGKSSLDDLPDPFQAICIHCEAVASFNKGDVKMVPVKSGQSESQ